jgi:hypothetical protein
VATSTTTKTATTKTAANTTASTPEGSTVTLRQWAQYLLQYMGLPETSNNINSLVSWGVAEGGGFGGGVPADRAATNNVLNTSETGFGATLANGRTEPAYPTLQDGIQATAATLGNGNYGAILNDLQSSAPPSETLSAVVDSDWAASHYGGSIPLAPASAAGTIINPYSAEIPNATSGAGTSSTTSSNSVLPSGVGGFLVSYNSVLNKSSSGFDILNPLDDMTMVIARGITVVMGLSILLGGLVLIVGPPVVQFLGGALGSSKPARIVTGAAKVANNASEGMK